MTSLFSSSDQFVDEPSSVAMPLILDTAVIQERLAAFPLTTYQPGENVFVAGSRTDPQSDFH